MTPISLSKASGHNSPEANIDVDILDITFPVKSNNELKNELLVFVVEDDPHFMQILNTHFSKLEIRTKTGVACRFKVRNFATGRSCLNKLHLNPDLVLLNYDINKGLPTALSGRETLDQVMRINSNQKVIILNDLNEQLRGAFVENGLRDFIIQDPEAISTLSKTVMSVLQEGY